MKIAVILASMDIEYVRETLQGIMGREWEEQNDLYIFNVYSGSEETLKYNLGEYNLYSLINLTAFDGVILFANMIQGHNAFKDIVQRIKASGVPTICVDTLIDGFCHVGTDSYQGMRNIVEHFIDHHQMTRFAYISGLHFNSDSRERLRAFQDVIKEKGIAPEAIDIYDGTFTFDSGYENAQKILEKDTWPQAIICANDSSAMGVKRALLEKGIKIPEQIAISGFDNSRVARNSVPVLTTAQHDQKRIGMEAAAKLNDFLTKKKEMVSELFPAPFIVGETCGCKVPNRIDESAVREEYIEMKENLDAQLHHNNMMSDDLNDSKDYNDFLTRLKGYVEKLECNKFYFCVCPDVVHELKTETMADAKWDMDRLTTGYPSKMNVELAYEYGKFVEYEPIDTLRMLPLTAKRDNQTEIYCFSPIHYRDQCLGYVVVEGSQFVMESPMYRTWLVNLSICLENFRKQSVLQKLLKQVDNLYVQDALTGLYNRFGFDRYAKECFERCVKDKQSFMIFFADLDGLKKINDRNGHEKGDIAIRTVASALRDICENGEICARFGGDEYVVYAQNYTEQDAILFGEKMEQRLVTYNQLLKTDFIISASYGYQIVYPQKGDTLEEAIKKADAQMYIRKKERKNRMNQD